MAENKILKTSSDWPEERHAPQTTKNNIITRNAKRKENSVGHMNLLIASVADTSQHLCVYGSQQYFENISPIHTDTNGVQPVELFPKNICISASVLLNSPITAYTSCYHATPPILNITNVPVSCPVYIFLFCCLFHMRIAHR